MHHWSLVVYALTHYANYDTISTMSEHDYSMKELTHHDFKKLTQSASMVFVRSALWALDSWHASKNDVHGKISPKVLRLDEGGVHLLSSAPEDDVSMYKPVEYFREYNQQITKQSDIYAMGAAFYQLITGTVPTKADQRRLATENLYEPLGTNKELKNNFPPQLLNSIDKALSLEKEDRWSSADTWRKELTISETEELQGINELLLLQLNYVKQAARILPGWARITLSILRIIIALIALSGIIILIYTHILAPHVQCPIWD